MSRSLFQRFKYGNSVWRNFIKPESNVEDESFLVGEDMIHLARQQIDAQKNASHEIFNSDIPGAQIIANEVELQTESLDMKTNQLGSMISASIIAGAEQISEAINMLGECLCVELSEIKWQLSQREKKLEEILEILNNSRNNEARQLVQQGLRHYINGEIEEAEERFNLALVFDTTDYQVLMNLAYIKIHKGSPSQAFKFFKKALSLPENLDSISKSRTLWATARLYYAEKDFFKAFRYGEEAFKYDNKKDPGSLYDLGVYAALAGKTSAALEKIEQAILMDHSFFSRCLVDQDLQSINKDILNLLGRLSVDAEKKAKQMVSTVENELAAIEIEEDNNSKENFIEEARRTISRLIVGLQKPSYSFCRRCAVIMESIQEAVSQITNLKPLYSRLQRFQEDFEIKNRMFLYVKHENEPASDFPPAVYAIITFISYVLPGFFLANTGAAEDGQSWLLFFIIWPIWTVFDFLGADTGATIMATSAFKGLLVVGVMWGVIRLIRKKMERKYNMISRDRSSIMQQFYEAKRVLTSLQNEISSKHDSIRERFAKVSL